MNAFYNISIFSLASRLISESPLLCNHFMSHSKQITIQNSYFQKYINPIYHSHESFTKFTISSTNIQNFLNQAIHVEKSIQWNDQQFFSPINSVRTPFEKINVTKCKFVFLNSQYCSGGAIQCFSSLHVTDCIFDHCKTIRGGGAIASYSELIMKNTDINYCEGLFSASIFSDTYHRENVYLDFVSTLKCKSLMSNGALTIKSYTNFLFSYSNLSLCENEGFYCGLWIDKSNVNVSFSYFSRNRNPDINGGITSIFTYSVFIDHTVFINLQLKAINNFGAVAIYVDKNLNRSSSISNCVFNYPDTYSSSINIRLGSPVNISSCCFSNPKKSEQRNSMMNFHSDNVFGYQCELIKFKKNKSGKEIKLKLSSKDANSNLTFRNMFTDKLNLVYIISPLLLAIIFSILFIFF